MTEEEGKRIWFESIKQPLVDPKRQPTSPGTSARRSVKRGRVKFYNQEKGWGFIEPQKKGEIDVFVHYSSIKKDGWRSLMPGEPVEYTVIVQSDGRVACGTVTGPDGADVQGYKPDGVPGPAGRSRVTDWRQTVDGVVFTKNSWVE